MPNNQCLQKQSTSVNQFNYFELKIFRQLAGVINDEITKVKSKFLKDNKVVEITRDKLTQDYIKYERFVRNDYKQVSIFSSS